MTDDSLADVQPGRVATLPIAPAAAAALDYVDGLHAFTIATLRDDVDAMRAACDAIDNAAARIAAQGFRAAVDAR